ncbi:26 kDa periplasmic immunogenic protein [Thalassocella blandensis]|nr:26 kDa periplasmic immunogenic protein [Thalassocella blandensis]
MKIFFTFLVAMALASASWAGEFDRPHITVFGSAKTEVVPDEMQWHVTVENRGAELKEVSKTHSDQVKQVLATIRKYASSEKDIQTSGMRFGENYVYRNNSRVKEGYQATTSINFKMTQFKKYEALWLALSEYKTVNVTGVSYDYSKKVKAQNETRVNALLAAKDKARALAKAMGSDIGEVMIIEEQGGSTPVFNSPRMAMLDNAESGSPISPGTISIEMDIKLVMAIIAK